MLETLGAAFFGFALAQLDALRRDRQAGKAEERKAALSVRQAALVLIGEMSSAEKDAEAMRKGTMSPVPLPADLWNKYGPTLALYPAYTDDWMRVITAYQVFDQVNKRQVTMDQAVGAAQAGEGAAWVIVHKIEEKYPTQSEEGRGSPLRIWWRGIKS